jgi:integrase
VEMAAHDARRTFARLAHLGHAGLDQIQLTLGHSSILLPNGIWECCKICAMRRAIILG